MTEDNSERTLSAILALEAEGPRPSEAALPTLDVRVQMYLRATAGEGSKAEDSDRARDLILQAMAEDLAEDPEPDKTAPRSRGTDFPTTPLPRTRLLNGLQLRPAPLRMQYFRRVATFAVPGAAALLVVAWSGAWFYALHSFDTTLAEWRAWEGKSGRLYSCATEGFGGFPFKVEMTCGGPTASFTTEGGQYTATGKMLRVAVDLFRPREIISSLEGPVTFAQAGKPDTFTGNWKEAKATISGPKPTPDGISIDLVDLKIGRVSASSAEPLAAVEKFAFRAELDPVATATTQKAAYELTSDISVGSLPSGPPIAARPIEARFKGVLHGVGDMIPKPLPERIKGWQRNGGTIEVTSVELHGTAADATAQGTLHLSPTGGVEGILELSDAQYDPLYAALTGKPSETSPRRSTDNETNRDAPTARDRKLPALRFEDGAAYFGSTPLGRLPALF
jgi:hypothetical protein